MVFVVIAKQEPELEPLVKAAFTEDAWLKVWAGQWLIYAPGIATSKELWTKLMGDSEKKPHGMVFPLTGYFGLASPSIWEWIAAKRNLEA